MKGLLIFMWICLVLNAMPSSLSNHEDKEYDEVTGDLLKDVIEPSKDLLDVAKEVYEIQTEDLEATKKIQYGLILRNNEKNFLVDKKNQLESNQLDFINLDKQAAEIVYKKEVK